MALSVECPACHKSYQVSEESLGSLARCEECGQMFTLAVAADQTHPPPGSSPIQSDVVPLGRSAIRPPQMLGTYVVQRQLGAGAMGQVWLAQDSVLKRDVAIKILPAEIAEDPERRKRFVREAQAAAQLTHSNAVTIYQIGFAGEVVFIAMELIDGSSLDKLVQQHGPMEWREATRAVRDAAAGLAAAHELGLVHRDVKPGNLMRTSKGVTKVVDFGLARAQFQTQLTQAGTLLGTPAFMAPEQWQGAEVDGRSDLYSLLCTYYYLLTGRLPFQAESFAALGYQHQHEPCPDPRRLLPQLPEGVSTIVARGTEKNPADRYQTGTELIAALDALLGSSPSTSGPTVQTTPPPRAAAAGIQPTVDYLRGRAPRNPLAGQHAAAKGREALASRSKTLRRIAAGSLAVVALGAIYFVITNNGDEKLEATGKVEPSSLPIESPQPQDLPPRDLPTPESSTPAPVENSPSGPIDLLKSVDPARDAINGKWTLSSDGLTSDGGTPFCRIKLPYRPPQEYDFRIEFTPRSGNDILQILAAGNTTFTLLMGGWGGKFDGFDAVRGHPFARDGQNIIGGPSAIKRGQRNTSVIEVRQGSITAAINGQRIEQKTDLSDLSMPGGWSLGDPVLGLGTTFDETVFHKIEVVEITGKGTLLVK